MLAFKLHRTTHTVTGEHISCNNHT